MNVLVLGGGGREHALCERARRSSRLGRLFILPGNAGTATLGTNIPGDASDPRFVLEVVRREQIDLTIIGPEDPLAAGVADALHAVGARVFGPRREAAQLESDKGFAKALMRQHAIPTPEWREFDDYGMARHYISTRDDALVVKAVGLAKGKGVFVCADPGDAIVAAERILRDRVFGDAGSRIVVEERLTGREVSVLALVDGASIYLLDPAQDHKRLLDGDLGPNTGGMGAYCPAGRIDAGTMRQIEERIFVPVLDALVRREVPYCGVLYAGLMLTHAGPKVLEFNCRFGDPEAQVILPRLRTDLLDLCEACIERRLDQLTLDWDPRSALCVVLAAPGYPDKVQTGAAIHGLGADTADDLFVFHAGTRLPERPLARGEVVTAGGRVLGVTGLGADLQGARERAYAALSGIRFEGMQFRQDIGRAATEG